MRAYHLLSVYWEKKVQAAIEALVYSHSSQPERRRRAEELASEAVEAYRIAVEFMQEKLDPFYVQLSGSPLTDAGESLESLLHKEEEERLKLASLFSWQELEEPLDDGTDSQ